MEDKIPPKGIINRKYTRISTYLIFLTVFLLIINAVMIFFIFYTVKTLENDASIINRMGVIRGSIQRVTKLELSGNRSHYTNLIKETDQLIESLLEDKKLVLFTKNHTDFNIENLAIIKNEWNKLKELITAYQLKPTDSLLIQILNKSEASWELADFATLNAQKVAENKVSGINSFYIILLIYTINVLLVIWVVYSYVRNNLELRASYDSLTKLANRHSYEKAIEAEIERSRRYKTKFSLIIFDIDYFKKINDTYGHEVGDKILIELSNLVKNTLRKSDEVFRVGGEEFSIIVPENDVTQTLALANKIRKKVETAIFYNNIKITLSLGIADSSSGKTISDIYRQADLALYKAKNTGRNKAEKYL